MDVRQTRYEVRAGEAVQMVAPQETLDFLANARSRHVEIVTGDTALAGGGLVAAPNRGGNQILLGASLRVKPGEYTVKLSATSATGEQRQTTLAVEVQPRVSVPSSATRAPVVLLNGWETGFTNTCPIAASSSDTFGSLAQYLVSDGVPVVYLFDNCLEGPGQPIEVLGNDLGAFLNTIQYDTGAQVPQIDLVGFSMGGLIARAYLAGLQPGETLTPPTTTLVGKLVLIATPNFGSFVAGTYAATFAAGSQDSELEPGSAFLWNLATWNQRGDDLRGVDAIAVIGNAGTYTPPTFSSGTTLSNASDGLVSLTSASLGFVADDATVTRIVPYCHVDPSAFTNTALGTFACNNAGGIANVNNGAQYTGLIVRSFLAGTSDWKSIGSTPAADPYLSKNGGMFFALVNGTGGYVRDMTGVTFGTVLLANGGGTGTIFYVDFVLGTGSLTATSSSLGKINCGQWPEPLGYTSALRCKLSTVIVSVGPLAETGELAVNAGTALTITGAGFGSQCAVGCKVVATPAGSSTGQQLITTAWVNTSITANLPASLTGLLTIEVLAAGGSDAITVMVNPQSVLAVAPASLQFAATVGGTAPAAQSIQIANSASGTLNWTATASASWLSVSPASGTAPSTLSVSVSPAGLSAGTYTGNIQITAAGASGSPAAVSVTLVVSETQPAGVIAGVANAASFQPGFAAGTWVSIFGTNLSQTTYTRQDSDFVNGLLPTSLQGVSVTINGVAAYVGYISPTQINVLAPDDATAGEVQVQVTAAQQTSNSFSAPKTQFAPAFFTFAGGAYVAAQHEDYSTVGAANLLPGVTTTPAQPGETILLYGTGFGPTNPPLPTGQPVTTAEPLANAVAISIGGVATPAAFAGLVSPGLYQFNVTVPNLPNGDAAVLATIGGVATQTGVSVTVQQ
jgi:uncharacterized protein (TIGR03437 family)